MKPKPALKPALKKLISELPFTVEAYWYLRQAGKPPSEKFSLEKVRKLLPEWRSQAEASPFRSQPGRRIVIFSVLRYWIEHAALLGLTLAGLGHDVTMVILPYDGWKHPLSGFDLRRQNAYALSVLRLAEPFIKIVSLLGANQAELPLPLVDAIWDNALRDTQYSLQVEDVDLKGSLFRLRLERDTFAARAALSWLKGNRPDVLIVPNGSILEFGAVFQAARSLQVPLVTYEFGEQRQRIWLAHNAEVMRQETGELWNARKDIPLTEDQVEQARTLFSARQHASLWENFARRWQGIPSQGGEQVKLALGLNDRPVVLLATNVIGDSLTLGRQAFSDSMTEWLEQTVQYFANRPDVQFVARIHPGELITKGPSVSDVVRRALPTLPENIHLVPGDAAVNTYDIVEIASLGLVYTTTVGMEMAMSGLPVIVAGKTHYRGKGFTLDPDSWDAYYELLDRALPNPEKLAPTRQQVEQAWNYAYRFFFEYPQPFPWHLVHIWKELEEWSVARVLSDEGQACFGKTFMHLVGEKINWRG